MRIVAIIPALDEALNIGGVVSGVRPHVDRVIVADNGSSDGTAEAARGAGAQVVAEPRRGYGRACLAAIAAAPDADVLLFLDGDGSDDPADAPAVLAPILGGDADMVVGSRRSGRREEGAQPWHAIAGTMLCVGLMNLLVGTRATDLGPFRAIAAGAYRGLGMADPNYGWTVEMQIRAARARLRVAEVPVTQRRRQHGSSKVSGTVRGTLGAGLKILWTITTYARLTRRGY
jgi:glycosyltransferase involved in cell wall biosynthesis